jgi:hypothetical protein
VAIAGLIIPLSQIASVRTAEAATAGDGPKPSIERWFAELTNRKPAVPPTAA